MEFGKYKYPEDSNNRNVIIFGVGEFARLAHDYFTLDSPYVVSGFMVDNSFMGLENEFLGKEIFSTNILGTELKPEKYDFFVAFSAVDLSYPRMQKIDQLQKLGFKCVNYVSSYSYIHRDVILDQNTFIFENNTIQSEVKIGKGTVIWSGNHIGHQTKIGDGCFISSHVCIGGRATIENNCYFGMNSTVRDQIRVGKNTVLGANSYLGKNSDGDAVLFGNPARVIPGSDPLKVIN